MLPYTPLHHLLFAAGAPDVLVMTSANRSSEPIAYEDDDARERLAGIADAFLVGERPIARRVDDSVVRAGALRAGRSSGAARGYAPGAVAPAAGRPAGARGRRRSQERVTLVVDGQAFVSQHIGDLDHYDARPRVRADDPRPARHVRRCARDELLVAHDAHPQYRSTAHALALPARPSCGRCSTIART